MTPRIEGRTAYGTVPLWIGRISTPNRSMSVGGYPAGRSIKRNYRQVYRLHAAANGRAFARDYLA
jgi:hypothetical protein